MSFGPFTAGLDPVERIAQLRCLAGLVATHYGSAHPLIATLRDAEVNGDALQYAAAQLDSFPALTRRRLLSTFGAVTWPRPSPRRGRNVRT